MLLNDGSLIEIENIYCCEESMKQLKDESVFFNGKILNICTTEAFTYPTNASDLGIYKINNNLQKNDCTKVLSDIQTKMILMDIYTDNPDDKDTYVLPLLHE